MNIISFFELQREKNKKIIIDNNLSDYKIWARKHLELHTKLSYLADETKCYKYWISEDEPMDKSILFERYLDCFSHIINLGLDRHYDHIEEILIKPNDYCLSDQFLNLFIDLNDLIISPSEDHYITLVEDFISLGITLGYSESKIKESFI
ncbi:dUTP diphosphatase [Clostridium tertium]|jgi:dimeric dUTPase (all-alpha-NTP-PPase superfamily)|uniref:dUTP diphosphatase n=1 Tax=Clostridium tertium TaxID=1559 RepID=UPI00232BE4C8|nr:dUTP diphosphatase [Clostridium tertium]MDB1923152.1 dUTP diphosphatase [Clostridium tertium]MDB1926314.1 dUTP diphosphatase [Clostridium tertium]MDB1930082.1 dUTP diphosphatase [Clostridium tertium]MDB1956259.1 dUTP diphosphatase [Clostridium tertium]MDB1960371.1 dUTP diphosphatase [Clostridium tertium]